MRRSDSRLGLAIVVVAVIALAAAVFVLTRDGPSEQLRALRDDPMGRFTPPGARLQRTIARGERSTGTFTKGGPAVFTRRFSLPRDAADRALGAALAAARAAGWRLSSANRGDAAVGEKRLATGPGFLTISLSRDGARLADDVDAPSLSIRLEHGSA